MKMTFSAPDTDQELTKIEYSDCAQIPISIRRVFEAQGCASVLESVDECRKGR